MKKFDHDSIVCFVGKPTLFVEQHGEEEMLCVAVQLRVMEPEAWAKVGASIWETDPEGASNSFASLQVAGEGVFTLKCSVDEYRVNFRQGNKKIVSLDHAKIDKVKFNLDDVGMTFRVKAHASGEVFGKLAELTHQKVRIDTTFTGEETKEPEAQMPLAETESRDLVMA